MQRELDDFFSRVLGGAVQVTAAAFCKARKALHWRVFEALNTRLLSLLEPVLTVRHWHGFRVMAIDSTILNLPRTPALFAHFRGQRQRGRELPMARLSQLWDVSTGLTWHAVLDPQSMGERVAACDHTEAMPADALVLFDRGYPGYFLCNWLRLHRRAFCMRVPKGFHPAADALVRNRQSHRVITLTANAAARAQCRDAEVSAEPLSLRLVRVDLPNGEIEILATSVQDEKACPDNDVSALYDLRWGIEGDFRVQKSRLQIENFSGRQPAAIHQDVHAAVLTKNLAQVLVLQATGAI